MDSGHGILHLQVCEARGSLWTLLGCETGTGHNLHNILTATAEIGPSKRPVACGSCGTDSGALVGCPEGATIVKGVGLAADIPGQSTFTTAAIVGSEALRRNEKLARAIQLEQPSAVKTMSATFKALFNTVLSVTAIGAGLAIVHVYARNGPLASMVMGMACRLTLAYCARVAGNCAAHGATWMLPA